MTLPKARTYRDPVHDIITWKGEAKLGPVISGLIDTPEFQRLRSVRQLGLASLVFHGAEHSRFAHSMGVAHIARRMCERLSGLQAHTQLAVVCAALLHDIGHAPFSHVMERVFSFHHEEVSARLVLDPETAIHQILGTIDAELPAQVAALLQGKGEGAAGHIVSSQLDADRADYLLRDALMTGVGVGRYDLERILQTLGQDSEGLVVDIGGYESVEGYLVARYHMYRLVYFHRTTRAAEAMVERVFARARHLIENGDHAVAGSGPLGKLMRQESLSATEHGRLGDFAAWSLIDSWRDHRDPILSNIATGLMERRLFRAVERVPDPHEGWAPDDRLAAEVRESLGENERWYFFVDDAGDMPYRPYQPGDDARRAIRIRDRDGRIFHIEERSHLARALAEATYQLRRWTFHPAILPKLKPFLSL